MIKKLIQPIFQYPVIRFLTAGAVGFLINAIFLYALHHIISLIPAVIVAYGIAFSVTWVINRLFTFHSKDPRRIQEWMRYALIYILTGCIHVLIFTFVVYHYPLLYQHPIGALFISAVVIAFINFTLSKRFAFKYQVE